MTIILENVTTNTLMKWMAEKIEIDEDEYHKWRAEQVARQKTPLDHLMEGGVPERTYVRGSDFRSYLSCARIHYWNVHKPVLRKVYLNKGTYGAIAKHELIQERLEERGWQGEFEPKRRLYQYDLDGIGHIDVLSPSQTFFVEIKHNRPSEADELQCAWYQYSHPNRPTIVILYRTRVVIIPDHSKFIQKYIPRVCGVIKHPEVVPPLHPRFPKCKGTCDYADRCGRNKRVPMHQGTPVEWIEYFKKIDAWHER